MSNQPHIETRTEDDLWDKSDHRPLQVDYRLNLTRQIPRCDLKPKIILIGKPTDEQIKQIFLHPHWPDSPFLEVA